MRTSSRASPASGGCSLSPLHKERHGTREPLLATAARPSNSAATGDTTSHNGLGSSVSLIAAGGHMTPDFDDDFSSRPDLFHGERVKIAQRAAKHRAH